MRFRHPVSSVTETRGSFTYGKRLFCVLVGCSVAKDVSLVMCLWSMNTRPSV